MLIPEEGAVGGDYHILLSIRLSDFDGLRHASSSRPVESGRGDWVFPPVRNAACGQLGRRGQQLTSKLSLEVTIKGSFQKKKKKMSQSL